MATQIKMPRQGQSVESCILSKLYVEEGSEIKEGDLLFAYETDKASFEYEAEQDGILLKWMFSEGDEVPVLETVCIVGDIGERVDNGREFRFRKHSADGAGDPRQRVEPDKNQQGKQVSEIPDQVRDYSKDKASKISPRARKMAEERGIDISGIKGSGPGGRIIVRDLEGAEAADLATDRATGPEAADLATDRATGLEAADLATDRATGPEDYHDEPLSNIRKIIARSMHQSLQNSAQLTHHMGADARKLLATREMIKERKGEKDYVNITINDLVCFALMRALAAHPRVNSQLHGETVRFFRHVNLGLAVDTERGLMVPVIEKADTLSIEEFSTRAADLAAQCRKGAVDPDILRPETGSFTVSNLGNYGVEMFTPVINLPQTAILGVNAIVPRPADLGDGVYGFVPYIGLSLTYDHRALDGGETTRFLKRLAEEIKNIDIK